MSELVVTVPDIGDMNDVEVIEVNVAVGDSVQTEDTLIVLESDKASMEIPSPQSGRVKSLSLAAGDRVSAGAAILIFDVEQTEQAEPEIAPSDDKKTEDPSSQEANVQSPTPEKSTQTASLKTINVPDLGGEGAVEVIEVNIAVGDQLAVEDTLIVLESDKASMEIPSIDSGIVKKVLVKVGDKVDEGAAIAELEVGTAAASAIETSSPVAPGATESMPQARAVSKIKPNAAHVTDVTTVATTLPVSSAGSEVYAGPAVRLMARELGVDLTQVPATGPKGRILKEDVQAYVKSTLQQGGAVPGGQAQGRGIPTAPDIDFSKFGDIEEKPLTRIQKLTATAMQRSWLNVPHVTQFDEADITALEAFRAQNKGSAQARDLKLTPLPFILQACTMALREYPQFNASLSASGETLIYKRYCHIGIAMNTPAGLIVPVIRDADKKGIWTLAKELTELSVKGQEGKLSKSDLEGGCFTISSLGSLGGTGFTPIVNTPEVAILGVSKTQVKPIYSEEKFVPRKVLPLALSYDHRAINGVDAGQFMAYLARLLADIRRLVM